MGSCATETCVHYWVIDPPTCPVSEGRCIKCGAEREFANYVDTGSDWDAMAGKTYSVREEASVDRS